MKLARLAGGLSRTLELPRLRGWMVLCLKDDTHHAPGQRDDNWTSREWLKRC